MKNIIQPIGTQIFAPKYHFTDNSLLESARGMLEMGCEVIKLDLRPNNYPEYTDFDGSSLDACRIPAYREIFAMPFKCYILWVQPADWFGEGKVWEDGVYRQIYDVARELLTVCDGQEKLFLLGNWEGDWTAQRLVYDTYAVAECGDMDKMARAYSIRQKAVEDARRDVPHTKVRVAHYVEVNRVLGWLDMGLNRLANYVLPKIRVDAISYSSYDANTYHRLTECLRFIDEHANYTDYLDGVFEKKIFVGEFDVFRDHIVVGGCPPAEQLANYDDVLVSALAYGCPFALVWEYYNNEPSGVYKLIDENGEKTALYHHMVSLIKQLERIDALFEGTFGRGMTAKDLSQLSYLLKTPSEELEEYFGKHKYINYLKTR